MTAAVLVDPAELLVDGGGEVTAFLRWAHGHAMTADVPARVLLCTPTDAGWRSVCFPLDQLDRAGRKARELSDAGANVYTRVHLLAGPVPTYQRGTGELTRWVTHVAADVDVSGPGHKPPPGKLLPPTVAAAVELIDATVAPSAIIASGGGLYPVWRLAEPWPVVTDADRQRVKHLGRQLDEALGRHGWHVDHTAGDLSRVIRPPGVENRKPGRDVRPVTVLRGYLAGAGDYTVAGLEAAVAEVLARTAPAQPAAPPRPPRPPRLSTTPSPWSIFADRYGVDDVLAADPVEQWVEVRPSAGWRRWRYVGSEHEYSIKQEHAGGPVIVWSSTVAARLGVEPGAGVDLWRLACGLAGVDPTAAARGDRR